LLKNSAILDYKQPYKKRLTEYKGQGLLIF